jgi:viroplasmin and RNaseH domain-containing protein
MARYVVYVGRQPGVYSNWDDAHAQVNGYSGACHKKFKCKEEAFEAFCGSHKEVKPVALDVKKQCRCVVHRVIIIFQFLIIVALVCKFM